MKFILITIFFVVSFFSTSIYTIKIMGVDNQTIDFNDFKGKKILLVNIATASSNVRQLAQLENLNRQFNNSLVIIVFPSNSFGNEPKNNEEIQNFCKNKFNVSFLIAAKADVKGNHIQTIYNWLSHENENGILEGEIKDDFQKYLIDGNGDLIGAFSGSKDADDLTIIQAIKEN